MSGICSSASTLASSYVNHEETVVHANEIYLRGNPATSMPSTPVDIPRNSAISSEPLPPSRPCSATSVITANLAHQLNDNAIAKVFLLCAGWIGVLSISQSHRAVKSLFIYLFYNYTVSQKRCHPNHHHNFVNSNRFAKFFHCC